MTWHVISRVGTADTYQPDLEAHEPRVFVGLRRPGDPHSLGPDAIAAITKSAGRPVSDRAADLLTVAMAAYAADLKIPRVHGADRWQRDIRLHVPVVDIVLWCSVRDDLTRFLGFLTGDNWELEFREMSPIPTLPPPNKEGVAIRTACLFSGGLDSLVGAIDLLSSGEAVALVGQHGSGMTNSVQQRVLGPLRKQFGSTLREFMFYVQPPKGHAIGEPSMRSRSILFLALGVAVASSLGDDARLVVAENGLISLNVPLTNARMGSLSTRTTHPHVMSQFTSLLGDLGIGVSVVLPYRFQTKGEMLLNAKDPSVLAQTALLSMSCSHPEVGRYHGTTPGAHCGYCVPCIIRRSSLNAAGMVHGDYDFDVVATSLPVNSDRTRDLRAFQMAIERLRGATRRDLTVAVVATGPLPAPEVRQYAEVYRRGMNEVSSLLGLGAIL